MAKMQNAAKIAVETCMNVKSTESVLVVCDTEKKEIGDALFNAARDAAKDVLLMEMTPRTVHGDEPPKAVADAMKKFDVVFCPTTYSLTHTSASKNAARAGARIATLPGITKEIFERAIDVDYDKIRENCSKLNDALKRADKVVVKTSSGTDLHIGVKGRKIVIDAGTYHKKGVTGNLPSGEIFLSPTSGTTTGILVIDHATETCKADTKIIIRKGLVHDVVNNSLFKQKMWKQKNARNVAEFGIGTNPKAILSGTGLEEEKVLGTCHVAFGSNFTFGGNVKADVHWDMVLLQPLIYFDNNKIMEDGELLL